MAFDDGGRNGLTEKSYTNLRNMCSTTDSVSNLSNTIDSVLNEEDTMQCAYSPQNSEIVHVLTNNPVSENQPEHNLVEETFPNTVLTNCTCDFESFDNVLQNLPKEMYIEKLLQLTSSNEQLIIEYRTFLCSRAKTIEGCPKGNLIQRRNTKANPSSVRYAKDCFALYIFCNGDNSHLSDVFDKKQDISEISSAFTIDQHYITQTLVERMHELEVSASGTDKIIKNMQKTITDLKSKNSSLIAEVDKMKSDIEVHATSCETFRKTTKARLKCVEGLDFTEEQAKSQKISNELSRLSKLCQSLQKQLSDIKMSKSYAAVVTPPRAPDSQSRISESTSRSSDHSQGSAPNNGTTENSTRNTQECPDKCKVQKEVTDENHNAPKHQSSVKLSDTSSSCPALTDSSHSKNNIPIPVHISRKPDSFVAKQSGLNQAHDPNQKRDVFLGITHHRRRNAQFYLTGIDCDTTRDGIINYVRDSNIRVTYLSLFQSKYNQDCLSAKIHVPEENRKTLCARSFWPHGVKCRPWINAHERQRSRQNDYKDTLHNEQS